MTNHRTHNLIEPLTHRLGLFDQFAHLLQFAVGQIDIARSPVLFQPVSLGGTRNRNEALGGNPCQSKLSSRAAFAGGKLLDLVDNGFVLVEVLALEFGDWAQVSA